MNRSINQRMRQVLFVGTILMIGASMGLAQSVTTGTVTGTVTLPDGAVSAGTTVVLEGKAGQRSAMTDDRGRFVFLSVLPGKYAAVTALAGFNTDRVEISVRSGTTVDLVIKLSIAAIGDEIVVTSVAPIVDTRKSSIDTTFNDELLSAVPTARDTFYDLAVTAAGMATVGADETWMPSPSAYGSATSSNIFLVDGVNTTNPRGPSWGSLVRVNYDTVQEVKVLSLGAQAEYGSFSGAAMDVITKSGGNEFHGSVGYYTQLGDADDNYTQSFGPNWLYANPADDIVSEPVDRTEVAATIGGPIIKDNLWFYAGYQDSKSKTDTPLWIPLDIFNSEIIDFKVTADLADNHRLWASYHIEDNRGQNITWGQAWDPTMRYDSLYDNTTLALHYQWVATDRDLFGFKYLGFKTDQTPYTPEEIGHPGYINWWKWCGTQAVGVNGDFPYIEGTENERTTIQADYTHYAEDWAGSHELKFGVQYTNGNGDWVGGYFQNYANFAYPYGWNTSRDYFQNAWFACDYTWCIAPTDDVYLPFYNRETWANPFLTKREAESTGFFVDDLWVVNDRLTLSLGMRYDDSEAKYGQGYVYEYLDTPSDINNPTVLRTREGQDVFDFSSWSPRLGFAWDITGDAKTVLRGHFGRYYEPLSVESLRKFGPDAAQGRVDRYLYLLRYDDVDTNGNGNIDPDEVAPATALLYGTERRLLNSYDTDTSWTLQVEPGTSQPYTDQFNLSLQRQLTRDLAVEVSYIYKVSKDMLVLRPYDPATGEFYEWESMPYTTSAGYQTQIWSIVLDDYNGDGVVDWSGDGAYVSGTGAQHFYRVVNVNKFDGQDVKQEYQGLQIMLNKRYSNRWQGMLAFNYTKTDGFYPRIVNQNWFVAGPLVMDTPFGASYNHFQNNLSGPALMTPEIMAKIAGSYRIPVIETDVGIRLRYDSGRPIWEVETPQRYEDWMGENPPAGAILTTSWNHDMIAVDPDDPDWMPSTTIIDLNLKKRFGFSNGMGVAVSLDAFNVFNEGSPNRVGYKSADYGRVYSLTTPRTYRLGLKFDF